MSKVCYVLLLGTPASSVLGPLTDGQSSPALGPEPSSWYFPQPGKEPWLEPTAHWLLGWGVGGQKESTLCLHSPCRGDGGVGGWGGWGGGGMVRSHSHLGPMKNEFPKVSLPGRVPLNFKMESIEVSKLSKGPTGFSSCSKRFPRNPLGQCRFGHH
jgi:hypothetical protein